MYVKTIEVPHTVISVTTDENYKYYWVRNLGEHAVGVFKNTPSGPLEGFHVWVNPRECVKVIPEETSLYFSSINEDTTNKIEIYGTNTADCPFKAGKKGDGSGGDNTHYKGTTTTPLENGSTTNPIVIDGKSYTAVFGDVVVYGYTEFVFDGTTWSEFGRPFDTVPTQGSTNAVTSDGIYKRTPFIRGTGSESAVLGNSTASDEHATAIGTLSQATQRDSFAAGYYARAWGAYSSAFGFNTRAQGDFSHVVGRNNNYKSGDLFEVGNGSSTENRSNILEVNATSANVNGDIQQNGVPIRATTMPTITSNMLGKVVQYVGETTNDYVKGYFYVASSDGAAEPTYSWENISVSSEPERITAEELSAMWEV